MYFSIQYFRYSKYMSRNSLQARNQGVEILLSPGQSAGHSTATISPTTGGGAECEGWKLFSSLLVFVTQEILQRLF